MSSAVQLTGMPRVQEPVPRSSASKALTLLEAIASSRLGVFGVSDVAALVAVPKSTAHRLLKELEAHGFVTRAGSKYRAGGRFFELTAASRWSEIAELREAAYPALSRLFEQSDAIAVHLAVLRGTDVFYVEKITRPAGTRLPSRVGGHLPARSTALGRALLAGSDQATVELALRAPAPRTSLGEREVLAQLTVARALGYACEREENTAGVVCVAAPILIDATPVAALSVSIASRSVSPLDRELGAPGRLVLGAAAAIRASVQRLDH